MGGVGEAGMRSRERVFTILVVEDHGVIALEFEDAIRRHGGLVLGPAVRVSDALALIETTECDAALLDIKLEHGETVYPVAERLYAKRIPFAFITGWDGGLGERYGNVPVLRKPFGEAELDRCLRMLIDRHASTGMKPGAMLSDQKRRSGTNVTDSPENH
jgi:DNA-binding response OmpR family regulator